MAKELSAQELSAARQCVDVLQAAEKGARTPGWFRGEVRGKEAVGRATNALVGSGLVQPDGGPQAFRLTTKGKTFVSQQVKDWESFLAKLNRPGNLEKVAKALQQAAASKK
jgi:hypothetical protein